MRRQCRYQPQNRFCIASIERMEEISEPREEQSAGQGQQEKQHAEGNEEGEKEIVEEAHQGKFMEMVQGQGQSS